MKIFLFPLLFPLVLCSQIGEDSASVEKKDSQTVLVDGSHKGIISATNLFDSEFTPKGARKAIKEGKPKILYYVGMGVPYCINELLLPSFEKKYNVSYWPLGCVRMGKTDEGGYNEVIFKYLDRHYGPRWRYEIYPLASGFEIPPSIKEKVEIECALERGADENSEDDYIPLSTPSPSGMTWELGLPLAVVFGLFFVFNSKIKNG